VLDAREHQVALARELGGGRLVVRLAHLRSGRGAVRARGRARGRARAWVSVRVSVGVAVKVRAKVGPKGHGKAKAEVRISVQGWVRVSLQGRGRGASAAHLDEVLGAKADDAEAAPLLGLQLELRGWR